MSEERLKKLLNTRTQSGSYRSVSPPDTSLCDFSSNDYLGLARSEALKNRIIREYQQLSTSGNGSTGSRLLTGSSPTLLQTEELLAKLFCTEAGLFFNSGYMANLAFFSSVPQKGDTILYDELAHACIKDGARLSLAAKFPFRHNDLQQLEDKLKRATGQCYIACESVYSMDGDFAPLKELVALSAKYGARLVVDEAHSTGIFGMGGNGLVNQLGLKEGVYAVIYTFGKAMGIHGAYIAGNQTLREFLINFARPFIYTTAPGDFESLSVKYAFEYLADHPGLQEELQSRISLFRNLAGDALQLIDSSSAIQAILIPGNEQVKAASNHLKRHGFDLRPILSPTVKANEERLRVCLHTFNTEKEIESLIMALNDYLS